VARFLNRALSLLEGLYRFEGSIVSSDQMDLSRPITLVHDTARGAAMLSAFTNADGYMLITATHTHGAGNTTIHSNVDPFLVTDASGKARQRTRIWALHTFADTDTTATFIAAQASNLTPVLPTGGSVSSRPQLLAYYNAVGLRFAAGSNFMLIPSLGVSVDSNGPYPVNLRPPPLGGTGGLFFTTNAGGASIIRLAIMCWAGPLGADPPPG